MKKACIVLTTIFDPVILESYYRNFERFGRLGQVEVIVIPDEKTPAAAFSRCDAMTRRGMKTECPGLQEQDAFLKSVGLAPEFVLHNSDHRRNVGFLMALSRDCDFLISLDDDNYAREDGDAFGEHAVVTAGVAIHEVQESSTRYFNVCDLIEFEGARNVYPRGYPHFARHALETVTSRSVTADISINAGLWLIDPDVDGMTWVVANPRARAFSGRSVVLGPSTWSPVNTQNTALRRDAVAAYYYLRMGYPVGGMPIGRFGDIFSGYFLQACAKHLGSLVRFGTPVADHRRNAHNVMRDAAIEIGAIGVLEEVLPWLQGVSLSGSTWLETYRALAEELERFARNAASERASGFLRESAADMKMWSGACERVGG